MDRNQQGELLGQDAQADLFGPAPLPVYRPDLAKVRARLHKILGEARAAERFPWEPARVSLYRTIVPDMCRYLPEEEGAALRREFEAEMERLAAA